MKDLDAPTAPPARRPGALETALLSIPKAQWSAAREKLARAYYECPRVRAILSRHTDQFKVDYDDLKQNVWLVFEEKILPILDNASHVYSVLFRCGELCSRTLLNARKEVLLSLDDGDDGDNTISHLLEQADAGTPDIADAYSEYHDTLQARQIFEEKLARVGWPDGVPREESAYKLAGRPRKAMAYNPAIPTLSNDMRQVPPVIRVAIEQTKASDQLEEDPLSKLSEPVQALHKLRDDMHLPVSKFAECIEIKVDTLRALLCGKHVNDPLARKLGTKARKIYREMLADPELRNVLKKDMVTLAADWRELLAMEHLSIEKVLKIIADACGLKFSTMYRWFKDNRKPIDIGELLKIDRFVRELAEQRLPKSRATAAKTSKTPASRTRKNTKAPSANTSKKATPKKARATSK